LELVSIFSRAHFNVDQDILLRALGWVASIQEIRARPTDSVLDYVSEEQSENHGYGE
jgi:hypothetical protein